MNDPIEATITVSRITDFQPPELEEKAREKYGDGDLFTIMGRVGRADMTSIDGLSAKLQEKGLSPQKALMLTNIAVQTGFFSYYAEADKVVITLPNED